MMPSANYDCIFSIATRRPPYHAADIASGLRWSCNDRCLVLLTLVGNLPVPSADRAWLTMRRVAAVPESADVQFLAAEALGACLRRGVMCKHVAVLSDECLITAPGLDAWIGRALASAPDLGCAGAASTRTYDFAYSQSLPHLYDWQIPHTKWEYPPQVLSPHAVLLPAGIVRQLAERNLLCPSRWETWPAGWAAYMSWVVQMLGHKQLVWGYSDRPLPPLHLTDRYSVAACPPPQTLSDKFMLYSSARDVAAYAEVELRELFKRFRGEPNRVTSILQPVLSPGPRPDIQGS